MDKYTRNSKPMHLFYGQSAVEPSAAPKISENFAIWAVVCQEMNQASKNNRW